MFSFVTAQQRRKDIKDLLEQIPILGMLSDNQEQYPPDIDNLFFVDTPDGRVVFENQEEALACAAKYNASIVARRGICIGNGIYLLLDANTPTVRLGVPESRGDIRKRALSKLTPEERITLGL